MQYYVQQLEYEMYRNRPTVFNTFRKIFKKGTEVLQTGVTERFISAIAELKQKALIQKGLIAQPKGKSLITQREVDLETLAKLEKKKKLKRAQKQLAVADSQKKPAADSAAKSPVTQNKPAAAKKTAEKKTVKPKKTKK